MITLTEIELWLIVKRLFELTAMQRSRSAAIQSAEPRVRAVLDAFLDGIIAGSECNKTGLVQEMREVQESFGGLDDGDIEGDFIYAMFAVVDLLALAFGGDQEQKRLSILTASDEMMLQLDRYGADVENEDAEDGAASQEERILRGVVADLVASTPLVRLKEQIKILARYSEARYREYETLWKRYPE